MNILRGNFLMIYVVSLSRACKHKLDFDIDDNAVNIYQTISSQKYSISLEIMLSTNDKTDECYFLFCEIKPNPFRKAFDAHIKSYSSKNPM